MKELVPRQDPELKDLEQYADRLPPPEVLIGRLWLRGMSQQAIAESLGGTQPAISFRLKSLRRRLRVLNDLPKVWACNFERDLGGIFSVRQLEVLKQWWALRSQNDIAKRLGISQSSISHLVREAPAKIEERGGVRQRPYAEAFRALYSHPEAHWTFELIAWKKAP